MRFLLPVFLLIPAIIYSQALPDSTNGKSFGGDTVKPKGPAANPEANLEEPCASFRVGKFTYATGDMAGISIVRKKKKHIEYNKITEEKAVYKVKWESDCEYILTFRKSSLKSRLKEGWEVINTIYETSPDYYMFKGDRNGIYYFGSVDKELSKKEKKKRDEEQKRLAEIAYRDSVSAAYEDSLLNIFIDSLKKEGLLKRQIEVQIDKWNKMRELQKADTMSAGTTKPHHHDSTSAAGNGEKKKDKKNMNEKKKEKGPDENDQTPPPEPGSGKPEKKAKPVKEHASKEKIPKEKEPAEK